LVETWVAAELRKALALTAGGTSLWCWRIQHGREVDFLLERGAEVVGIEAKWSQVRNAIVRSSLGGIVDGRLIAHLETRRRSGPIHPCA
jgi:hypothetical protein